MFQIRGENIYPSEIDSVLNNHPDYGGEHRIIISREASMDELLVRVEATPEVYQKGKETLQMFSESVVKDLHRALAVRTNVEVAGQNSIERTDFKARRVIDDRDLYRSLSKLRD